MLLQYEIALIGHLPQAQNTEKFPNSLLKYPISRQKALKFSSIFRLVVYTLVKLPLNIWDNVKAAVILEIYVRYCFCQ